MNRRRLAPWATALAQAILIGCTAVLCNRAAISWPGTGSLVLMGMGAVGACWSADARWRRLGLWGVWLGWLGSLLALGKPILVVDPSFTLDRYQALHFAVIAWLIAAIIVPLSLRQPTLSPRLWPAAAMLCALAASMYWLGASYLQGLRFLFYLGLPPALVLLVLVQLWFRLPTVAIQTINTLIFLLLAVPLADLCRPAPHLALVLDHAKPYSYAAARKDPVAFMHWWNFFNREWERMSRELFMKDPAHLLPYAVRPDQSSALFQSRIHINRLGFRGPEFAREKGRAFRIVALGESTTFGCTLGAQDRPWPELLEDMIRERLKPSRPVQVINAGLPSFSLRDNLRRLPGSILPLDPDLIVSYHGYNGFPMLDSALPPVSGRPPEYKTRALSLLADAEYRLKLCAYRRRLTARRSAPPAGSTNLLQSEYAQAYGDLICLARSNHVRLVLANFSMAVNAQSDPNEVAFYQLGFPMVSQAIQANSAHSRLLRELAPPHPDVCFVDTQPGLDGQHEKFVDLVHLTQEGRQQLAEAVFAGMRDVLEKELAVRQPPDP